VTCAPGNLRDGVFRFFVIELLPSCGKQALWSYDKVKADGTVMEAPRFTYRVLDSVPVLFQLAEWLLVIVAFQYVDIRFGYISAKITWLILSLAFALYVGVLASNVLWRAVEDPYRKGFLGIFSWFVFPLLSGVVVYGTQHLVKQMVLTQQAGA
jgi:hypothetical protein